MLNYASLFPGKLYKISTQGGESLGDWVYFNETPESYIFHCAAVHGVEMIIQKEAMPGLEFAK